VDYLAQTPIFKAGCSLLDLSAAIKREIPKVREAKFLLKGRLSPECRNFALGRAIDSFDKHGHQVSGLSEKGIGPSF
jgi:hypothetical protein